MILQTKLTKVSFNLAQPAISKEVRNLWGVPEDHLSGPKLNHNINKKILNFITRMMKTSILRSLSWKKKIIHKKKSAKIALMGLSRLLIISKRYNVMKRVSITRWIHLIFSLRLVFGIWSALSISALIFSIIEMFMNWRLNYLKRLKKPRFCYLSEC